MDINIAELGLIITIPYSINSMSLTDAQIFKINYKHNDISIILGTIHGIKTGVDSDGISPCLRVYGEYLNQENTLSYFNLFLSTTLIQSSTLAKNIVTGSTHSNKSEEDTLMLLESIIEELYKELRSKK